VDATGKNPSDHLVHGPIRHLFAAHASAPGPTTGYCASHKERVVIPRVVSDLVVKLRSFRCAMPVAFGMDSLVRHMDPHHFATGMLAPTPSTAFSTDLQ
jgi:hypothetical protein